MTQPGRRRVIRSSGRFRSRGPSRTSWARLSPATLTTVAAASKSLVSSFVLSNPGIGETVRRTIGQVLIVSDQAAATEAQLGALGMVVVSDIALAAGAASIPGPVTEKDDDGWFLWVPLTNRFRFLTAAGFDSVDGRVFHFDSRGMRKIEEGFSVAVMVENASASTGFSVHVQMSVLSSRR